MTNFVFGFAVGFLPFAYSKGWITWAYDKVKAKWFPAKDATK
jgi:hypothetical protein